MSLILLLACCGPSLADLIQYDIVASYSHLTYHWVYRIDAAKTPSSHDIYTYSAGDVYATGYSSDYATLEITDSTGGTPQFHTNHGASIIYKSLPPGHPNSEYRPPGYDPDPRPYGMDYEITFNFWHEGVNGPNNGISYTSGLMLEENYFDGIAFPFLPIAPDVVLRPSANIHVWSGSITISASITVSVIPEAKMYQVAALDASFVGDINNSDYISGSSSTAVIIHNGQVSNIHDWVMGDWSSGQAINEFEHVVGSSRYGAYFFNGSTMEALGENIFSAFAVNESDQVAAIHRYDNPDPRESDIYTAVLWEDGEVTTIAELPRLQDYYKITDPLGVNDILGMNNAGQVVGPFGLFDKTNGVQDIKPTGIFVLRAKSINEVGNIVGAAGGTHLHAFVRTNETLIDLGTFGGENSCANDINDNNEVVGFSATAGETNRAFYWTDSLGVVDLNTLIETNSGWILRDARAINNSGLIIGSGVFNGEAREFLLSPVPEPATTSLVFSATSFSGMPPSMTISNGAYTTPLYVQRCTDLINTNWVNITVFTTGVTNWTDSTVPASWTSIYYRLVQ